MASCVLSRGTDPAIAHPITVNSGLGHCDGDFRGWLLQPHSALRGGEPQHPVAWSAAPTAAHMSTAGAAALRREIDQPLLPRNNMGAAMGPGAGDGAGQRSQGRQRRRGGGRDQGAAGNVRRPIHVRNSWARRVVQPRREGHEGTWWLCTPQSQADGCALASASLRSRWVPPKEYQSFRVSSDGALEGVRRGRGGMRCWEGSAATQG